MIVFVDNEHERDMTNPGVKNCTQLVPGSNIVWKIFPASLA